MLLRVDDRRRRLREYLLQKSCVDCGENNWKVLEFDHVRGKKRQVPNRATIAYMVSRAYGWETILKEITKCDVVCANCHRLRTIKRENSWRNI